jgi:hypothetical protein
MQCRYNVFTHVREVVNRLFDEKYPKIGWKSARVGRGFPQPASNRATIGHFAPIFQANGLLHTSPGQDRRSEAKAGRRPGYPPHRTHSQAIGLPQIKNVCSSVQISPVVNY